MAHSCAGCQAFTIDLAREDCISRSGTTSEFLSCLTTGDFEAQAANGGCVLARYVIDAFNKFCNAECQARRDKALRPTVEVFTGTQSAMYIEDPQSGGMSPWFTLFASKDNPAAEDIPLRPVNCDPASPAAFQSVRTWLGGCQKDHSSHAPNPDAFMPTRVLEILEPGTPGRVRINERAKPDAYAVLSYCWGGPQKLSLTKSRLGAGTLIFAKNELPATIRDAVQVTEELGLRFLWVDALCIVQDDPQDKAAEISVMADIYASGTVTIMASRSSSVEEGFLHSRFPFGPTASDQAIKLAFRTRTGKQGSVWAVDHQFWRKEPEEPLNKRGWALQEYLLSPRILSYGRFHTTWICNKQPQHSDLLALGSDGLTSTPLSPSYQQVARMRGDMLEINRPPNSDRRQTPKRVLARLWYDMVSNYMGRELTYSTDRLAGLAAVAQRTHSVLEEEYLAGLWSGSMLKGLLWRHRGRLSPRPTEYCAPSWSWASAPVPPPGSGEKSEICFSGDNSHKRLHEALYFSIVDCRTVPVHHSARFGSIESGYLTVTGLLIPAFFDNSTGRYLCAELLRVVGFPGTIIADADAIEKEWERDENIPLHLLCVAVRSWGGVYGLILWKLDTGEYTRKGRFRMYWSGVEDGGSASLVDSWVEPLTPVVDSAEKWVEVNGEVKEIVII